VCDSYKKGHAVEVGFGQGVVTPAVPVVLAGFGARKDQATEVHDDLEAHAVVLRDGGTTVCLLVLDLLLLGPDFARPVREAVGRVLGIPAAQVLTACVHTHAGPAASATMKRARWPVPPGYLEVVLAGCVEAATRAQAALTPATLGYARAPLPEGLGFNRRELPYDPSYAVLDVRAPDGTRLGTIGNVGIHPVALGTGCRAVSSDWVGSYRTEVRRATGAPAVLLQGALGDVNPVGFQHEHPVPDGDWETARVLGVEVAEAVGHLLGTAAPLPDEVSVVARRVSRHRASVSLASVLSAKALRRVDVELLEWSLGGIRLVSVPGEPFDALGKAILSARDDRALIAAIAPEWLGYLPAPFRKGYEEQMSYGRRFVAAVSELLTTPPR
jgi:hypothetical protein